MTSSFDLANHASFASSCPSLQLLVDARLELEVEVRQRFHGGEMGVLDVHRDALSLFAGELLGEETVDKFEIRDFFLRSVREQRVETLGDVTEPKARKVRSG